MLGHQLDEFGIAVMLYSRLSVSSTKTLLQEMTWLGSKRLVFLMGLTGLKAFMLLRGEGESGREPAAQELMPQHLWSFLSFLCSAPGWTQNLLLLISRLYNSGLEPTTLR